MGQYYLVVNLDKEQYLHPHKFGDGMKLLEFGLSSCGTLSALAVLLADGNNRGGGDLRSDDPIIGSWSGDRIVIAGDYADPYKFVPEKYKEKLFARCYEEQEREDIDNEAKIQYAKRNCNLFNLAECFFEDISEKVLKVLRDDYFGNLERGKSLRPDVVVYVEKKKGGE